MIGNDITRIWSLRARRDAADAEGRDEDAQRFDVQQMDLEKSLRDRLNAMLAGEGANVEQIMGVLS